MKIKIVLLVTFLLVIHCFTRKSLLRAETYRQLNKSAHAGYSGPLRNLVDDTEALIEKMAEKLS